MDELEEHPEPGLGIVRGRPARTYQVAESPRDGRSITTKGDKPDVRRAKLDDLNLAADQRQSSAPNNPTSARSLGYQMCSSEERNHNESSPEVSISGTSKRRRPSSVSRVTAISIARLMSSTCSKTASAQTTSNELACSSTSRGS